MKESIEELVSSNNDTQLSDADRESINEIFLEVLTDESVKKYFEIVSQYIDARRSKELLISEVAKKSNLPEMTVKRFENLQTIPKILTLLKILKSVGLEVVVRACES